MVEGALRHIRILERMDYRNMVISLKASDVPLMIEAYERLADKVPYALHLGVTEAGLVREGSIKSAIGIGTLLHEGIGDTIRVSLTGDPVEEVKSAKLVPSACAISGRPSFPVRPVAGPRSTSSTWPRKSNRPFLI